VTEKNNESINEEVQGKKVQKSEVQYRDTLIRKLFEDKERAIELCNAITGSNFPRDTKVILCDLDNSLTRRYNDLAFAIDDQLLFMIEHQSTISPNLPLRFLSYVTDILYAWFVQVKELYKKKLYQIPVPKLYVLYNGDKPLQETQLKLSDAFYFHDEEASLELVVEVIDVNYQSGHEILEKCDSLKGYSYLIDQIRIHMACGYSRDEAIGMCIDLCIEEGVLSDFLKQHYQEVARMINFQYDQELEYQAIREEERAEGWQEGHQEGQKEGERQKAIEMAKKLLSDRMSFEMIEKYTGLPLELIKTLSVD